MPGTILLGIDVETAGPGSANYARLGPQLLADEGVRGTWFVTGKSLDHSPDLFRGADRSGLVDLQAHTYDHLLLKTVLMQVPPGKTVHGSTDFFMQRGAAPDELDRDLARCQQVFERVLGRRAVGLCGPWCYYRGLGDRPDLLEMVHRHGFRILRTFGRDEHDCQPVPMEWQPFFYKVQGFPDTLELLVHDYQDDFYFMVIEGVPDASTYPAHLRRVADRVAREDLVWSLCSHDHDCRTPEGFARKTAWLREIVHYAKSIGIRFLTVSEYYEERVRHVPHG